MFVKPIKIVRVTHGYNMFVNDVPVVKMGSGKASFDREKAGVGMNGPEAIPDGARPMLIKKQADAFGLAHTIGNYLLGLGGFVDTYVETVGFPERT